MLLLLSVLKLQWQLIGKIDDIMHFKKRSPFQLALLVHPTHQNVLVKKHSNRGAIANAILLVAMDPIICLHLNVVLIKMFGTEGDSMYGRSSKGCLNFLMRLFQALFLQKSGLGQWGHTALARALNHI
jgi:hypothetical protein